MARPRDPLKPLYPVGKYPRSGSATMATVYFSRRQLELLNLAASGKTVMADQAAVMKLKVGSIKQYWMRIYEKLRAAGYPVDTKTDALLWFVKHWPSAGNSPESEDDRKPYPHYGRRTEAARRAKTKI